MPIKLRVKRKQKQTRKLIKMKLIAEKARPNKKQMIIAQVPTKQERKKNKILAIKKTHQLRTKMLLTINKVKKRRRQQTSQI